MKNNNLNFAVVGVSGYVAPRHLVAIRETGNRIVAAVDPHDSVGILDKYGFNIKYFKEIERFERFIDKSRRQDKGNKIDWVSVCSPNYLHDAHIRLGLRNDANVICEKPIVINPWNLDLLKIIENETGKRVYTVLQLRVHPQIIELKERMKRKSQKRHQVEMTYITCRGNWYHNSWKGKEEYSGGLALNIGIHLFDLLVWLFGAPVQSEVHFKDQVRVSGAMILKNADVKWFLSIEKNDLPLAMLKQGKGTYRKIVVDQSEIEFSEGFADLHTELYRQTLKGKGFGIDEARDSLELVYRIRCGKIGNSLPPHPILRENRLKWEKELK